MKVISMELFFVVHQASRISFELVPEYFKVLSKGFLL